MKQREAKGMDRFQEYFNKDAIVATLRKRRPMISKEDTSCPFCLHNKESLPEILEEKWQGQKLWVRVVTNKYPITGDKQEKGFHEVIIDTGDHQQRPMTFSNAHWQVLLLTLQERWRYLMKQQAIQFIQIFKNDGEAAGASISHSHWQLIALKAVPLTMQEQYITYNESVGDCYLCTLEGEGFLIQEAMYWRIWTPPVPEFDREVWLVPKKHYQHYGQLQEEEIEELGKLMKQLLIAYDQMVPQSAYNICFMSGDLEEKWCYHFHIRLVMRSGHIAGFEIATGCHVLTQSPQEYTDEIKKILKGI